MRTPRSRHWLRRALLTVVLALLSTLAATWLVPLPLLRLSLVHTTNSPDTFWTDGVRGGHYIHQHHALLDWIAFRRIIFSGPVEQLPYFNQNRPPPWAAVVS